MRRRISPMGSKQTAAVLIGCVFLFSAFALMVYGRFATSLGVVGFFNRASLGVAFIAFGFSLACFTVVLYFKTMHRKRVDAPQLLRECAGLGLGLLCYVVPFLLAMGALSAAGRIGVAALAIIAVMVPIPFLYRRHRKKDPIAYPHVGTVATLLLCAGLTLVSLVGGAFSCSESARDLHEGWRQDTFAVYDVDVNRPSGRGAPLTPTTYEIDLFTSIEDADAERPSAHVSISEVDWPAVQEFFDSCEGYAQIRWYPVSGTVIGMRDEASDRAVGDALE